MGKRGKKLAKMLLNSKDGHFHNLEEGGKSF